MRILAEEAAGGDMARLDKMFETGELHTATYLPKVLRRMREESDKLMPHYRTTLPYWQSQSKNQGERWMRAFGEGGGESGVSRFWHVMATIQRETIDLAPKLGKAFETISWGFSNMLLIPTEFRRWAAKGDEDISNFFQRNFGDFDESTFAPLVDAWNNLTDSVLMTVGKIRNVANPDDPDSGLTTIQKITREFTEPVTNAMNYMTWATNRLWGDQYLADEAALPLEAQTLARAEYWKKFGFKGNDRGEKAYVRQRSPEIEEGLRYDLEGKKDLENYLGTVNEESKERQSILESIKKFWSRPPYTHPDGWEYNPNDWKERNDQLIERAKSEYGINQFGGEAPDWMVNPFSDAPKNDPSQIAGVSTHNTYSSEHEAKITININSVGTTREQAQLITDHVRRELDIWSDRERKAVAYNIAGVMA